ncbi:MAG: acetoacetate--CoA ligase, partial [Actinomycetota bacterium]|nr:acetoacetate--CoA ligase [Actinomycetota bacterium]
MIGDVLWEPGPDALTTTNIGRFMSWLEEHRGLRVQDYESLRAWSVTDVEGFWSAAWEFLGVRSLRDPADPPYDSVLSSHDMPGAAWFDGARLNYADHALRWTGSEDAVVAWSQTRDVVTLD